VEDRAAKLERKAKTWLKSAESCVAYTSTFVQVTTQRKRGKDILGDSRFSHQGRAVDRMVLKESHIPAVAQARGRSPPCSTHAHPQKKAHNHMKTV
jgi:hypothetical protein